MNNKQQPLRACLLAIFLLFSTVAVSAQDSGIAFTHHLSWKAVLEKAKKENKYIFVDCFTTWCGPCKMMSRDVFPQKEVGDFFNEHFISIKMQMDRTPKDDDEVKAHYADAEFIGKEYGVMAYPTFLYFTPAGKLVHLVVGGDDAKAFIARSADALNPEKQYYTRMETAFKDAASTPGKLKDMIRDAKKMYDGTSLSRLMTSFMASAGNIYNQADLLFIDSMTMYSKDPGFKIFLKESARVDAIMGKGFAVKKTDHIIAGEELYSKWNGEGDVDLKGLEAKLKKKYPQRTDKLFGMFRLNYYQRRNEWGKFQAEVPGYVTRYGSELDPRELGVLAGSLARNCSDKACLELALEWSRTAMATDPSSKTVHANLLYKLNRKEEGIALLKNTVAELAQNTDKQRQYELKYAKELLEKMEKGEKTWKN